MTQPERAPGDEPGPWITRKRTGSVNSQRPRRSLRRRMYQQTRRFWRWLETSGKAGTTEYFLEPSADRLGALAFPLATWVSANTRCQNPIFEKASPATARQTGTGSGISRASKRARGALTVASRPATTTDLDPSTYLPSRFQRKWVNRGNPSCRERVLPQHARCALLR
jgi:hypothetical protein